MLPLVVLAFDAVGFWRRELLPETVLWLGATGLMSMGPAANLQTDPQFFRRVAAQVLGIAVVIELVVNLFPFEHWVELLLVTPSLAIPATLEAVAVREARTQPERGTRLVAGCFTSILAVLGLLIVVRGVWLLLASWSEFDWELALRLLAWPAILTGATLPFFFALGLSAAYGSTLLRLSRWATGNRLPWRTRLAVLVGFNVRVWELGRLKGMWHQLIADAETFREFLAVVRALRRTPDGQEIEEAYRRLHAESPRQECPPTPQSPGR